METNADNTSQTPAPNAPHTIRDYLVEYRDYVVAIALAVAIVAGVSLWRAHKQRAIGASAEMLSAAKTARNLETLLTDYPGTPSAQIALLALAKSQYDDGDYSLATSTYDRFQKQYPKHPMVDVAVLGKVQCAEAIGKSTDALTGYQQFLATHTNHYLDGMAVLGQARCLEQLGRLPEAKAVYEDYIASHAESAWRNDMDRSLLNVEREIARAKAPTP